MLLSQPLNKCVVCLLFFYITLHIEDVLNTDSDLQIRNKSCSSRCINTTSASFGIADARAIRTESSISLLEVSTIWRALCCLGEKACAKQQLLEGYRWGGLNGRKQVFNQNPQNKSQCKCKRQSRIPFTIFSLVLPFSCALAIRWEEILSVLHTAFNATVIDNSVICILCCAIESNIVK